METCSQNKPLCAEALRRQPSNIDLLDAAADAEKCGHDVRNVLAAALTPTDATPARESAIEPSPLS